MRNFGIMRYFLPILIFLTTFLIGCKQKTNNTVVSDDARVSTFTFASDTLNPGLTAAIYKVEHLADTGLISCTDSLRFQTRLDSVVPLVTYMATPGVVNFVLPDTTIVSTGVDTMNFNQSPIYLHVTASDMKTEKWYRIKIAAHKVNPYLYVWKQLTNAIFPAQNCETKAFYSKNRFVLYTNNGLSTQIYQSKDAAEWKRTAESVDVLPTPCYVRDIVQHNDTLYYISNNKLYTSSDLATWAETTNPNTSFTLQTMLLSYDDKPWCIVQDVQTNKMMLATIAADGIHLQTDIRGLDNGALPASFPISDYATLAFYGSSERPRAMIVGGRDMNGNIVNSRWNIEYSPIDGYRLTNFSITQPTFKSLTGASIIYYNDRCIMFGGTDNNLQLRSDILYSDDEGMNWYAPAPDDNQLPSTYKSRQNQSVFVDNDDNIYIIGGQSNTETFRDVHRGYLNSAKWE